jgi:hypothetical protein
MMMDEMLLAYFAAAAAGVLLGIVVLGQQCSRATN